MSNILSAVIKKLLSEKILIAILLNLGDYLVRRSSNDLDDKIWAEVRKAFTEK